VGLNADDAVWDATVFTKNRDRLLEADVAQEFLARVVEQARLHPSRGHFQSSLVGLRPRTRHLSLEGLRPRRQAWHDDTCGHRVLTALLSARAPQGIRAHPSLWLPRQSLSCFPLGSIPTSAVEQLLHASRSWTLQSFGGGFLCLALPTLRRDHDRGSEIYRCGIINMLLLRFFLTPLPLSTRGCALARGRTRVSASSPLPRKQLSPCALAHLSRHSDHPDGIPTTPRRSPQSSVQIQVAVQIP